LSEQLNVFKNEDSAAQAKKQDKNERVQKYPRRSVKQGSWFPNLARKAKTWQERGTLQ
jgi:hypothetical protein